MRDESVMDEPARDEVGHLLGLAGALLASLDVDMAGPFLADWPDGAGPRRATMESALPVLASLNAACRGGWPRAVEVLKALDASSGRLAWRQTYSAADFGAAFLDRYGWTELAGERGPIASGEIAVGFLLLGPDVTYPLHSHDAEEIYLVLSGVAAWRRGDGPWGREAPGALVHHPSRMPHAMRTDREPLLTLYAWRGGDLAQKSAIERSG